MKTLCCLIFLFVWSFSYAQLDTNLTLFEEMAEVELPKEHKVDEWVLTTKFYPSGNKLDEVKVFVSEGCLTGDKCVIKYQHQVYFDDKKATIALKEGKYLTKKHEKAIFNHFGWWYTNQGKEFRRVSEKRTKIL